MRARLVIGLLIAVSLAVAQDRSASAPVSEEAATAFVRDFFKAFDARDTESLRRAFLPDAKIVHDNGVVTSIPQMLEIVRSTKEWPPRTRNLSEFEFTDLGDVVIAGCLNTVRFTPVGRAPVEYSYRETWVLKATPQGLRAARSHYSAVSASEHSEDVP